MNFLDSTKNFLTYLEKQRGYSINTVDAYQSDLKEFVQILDLPENAQVAEIFTKANVREFVYSLKESGQKSKSIARKRSCLLSFGNFLLKREAIAFNPVRLVFPTKIEKTIPAIITQPQMEKLAESYSGETQENNNNSTKAQKNKNALRDKLIVELLYGSGVRVSELQNLLLSSFDLSNGTIRVMGKGNKQRIVPLTDICKELFLQYRKENLSGEKQGFLFRRTARNGRPESKNYAVMSRNRRELRQKEKSLLTVRRIRQIVVRELSKVSSAKKRSPHILRHSFASHLLDNGADIRVVKEMLGHSSLASTQVYTHVNVKKMLKSFKQAHPRSGQ